MLNRTLPFGFALCALVGALSDRAIAAEEDLIPPPPISQQLPANTAALALIRSGDVWQGFQKFQGVPASFDNPGFLPFVDTITSYNDDVKPWVGEWAASAVLSLSSIPSEIEAAVITLVPLADEAAFASYLDRMAADRSDRTLETYKGVEIQFYPALNPFIEVSPPETPPTDLPPAEPAPENPESPPLNRLKALQNGIESLKQYLNAQMEPMPEPLPPAEDQPLEMPGEFSSYQPSMAVALLPDGTAIFAPDVNSIKGYLDLPANQPSLADNPEFQKLTNNPEFSATIFATYGNFKQIAQLIRDFEASNPALSVPNASSQSISDILDLYTQTYSTFEGFLWADDLGGRAHFRTYYRDTPPAEYTRWQNDNRLLTRIPGNSYFSANSRDLAYAADLVIETYEQIPELATLVAQLRQTVRDNLGLEVEDLFGWMDGEFALFTYPTRQGSAVFPLFPLGVGLLVETSDRPAADRVRTALDEFVSLNGEGFITVTSETIEEQPFVSWNAPFAPDGSLASQVAHGWLDENVFLLTTGLNAAAQLYPEPYTILPNSYNFQTAIAPFNESDGYLYYNISAIVAALNPLISSFGPPSPDVRPVLDFATSMRSFSMGFEFSEKMETVDVRLVLSPARN